MEQMRGAKEMIVEASLNEYERAVFGGLKQSRGSKAVKQKALSEAVANVMNGQIEIDGSEMSVAEALVVKAVGDALANPSTSKLKDFASIVGDMGAIKLELDDKRLVDVDLTKMAIGEDSDGESR